MFTSFNEPSRLEYKPKLNLLFWLNHIPYKGFLFEFFRSKFPRLSKCLAQEDVVVIPRIVEHPLVFRNLELAWKNTRRWMLGKQIVYRTSPGYKVYGIDTNNYGFTHPNFQFSKGDITRMPFPNDFFNYVIPISPLQNVGFGIYGDPIMANGAVKAILEMRRVLKPHGAILISVPYGGKPYPKASYWPDECAWHR